MWWVGSSLCFAGLVGGGVSDQAGVHLDLVEERLWKTGESLFVRHAQY